MLSKTTAVAIVYNYHAEIAESCNQPVHKVMELLKA